MTFLAAGEADRGEGAVATLARQLARHAGERAFRLLEVSAPVAPATRLLSSAADDAVFWSTPAGVEIAGLGAAAEITASGTARFESMRAQGEQLLATCGGGALYGGFAFREGCAPRRPWERFGDARFVLPRWGYSRTSALAKLTLTVRGDEVATPGARDAWLEQLAAHLDALSRPVLANPPVSLVDATATTESDWCALVESTLGEIAAGRAQKIVLARSMRLALSRALDPAGVLERLSQDFPACTRFAFRRGARTFLGATPERLVEKRGLAIATEALAGSISAGDGAQAKRLLASKKDRGEHAFVVRHVIDALAPVCGGLDHAGEPEIRGLRNVLHLCTPITGTLAHPRHILELVARLHPTPAVGGTPAAAALDWIAAHEPDARGWYAGPIGWFDAAGDGDFCVGLRSGVIDGSSVDVYAGAGIVQGSDPAAEYAETRTKLAAFRSALEIQP